MRINGVELRYGRTFVGRILPHRVVGARCRFTSIAHISITTKAAILAVANRGGTRRPNQLAAALARVPHTPGRGADDAVAVAAIVLAHRDQLETPALCVQPDASDFQPWHTDVGDLNINDW